MINLATFPQKIARLFKRILFSNFFVTKIIFLIQHLKWRQHNQHNHTYLANSFNLDAVQVGNFSYGPLEVYDFDDIKNKLIIKSFVSIAHGVKFILGGNHYSKGFSNYPFKVNFRHQHHESLSNGPIVVESDVWIGMNATILSGVTIGQGAIIGSEAVVSKNVPPYAVVVGNPGVVKKFRFDEKTIERLLKINFDNITHEIAEKISHLNYSPLNEKTLEEIETIMSQK